MNNGWIKIHRIITEWEWYDDPYTLKFFIHCLLSANHEKAMWHGVPIERGQFISSIGNRTLGLNFSPRRVRTCIERLKSTGEMTSQPTNRFSLYTMVKYGFYQSIDMPNDKPAVTQATSKRQARDKQETTNKKKE